MKFTSKELIAGILNSKLSNEDKINLLDRIMNTGQLNDGLFLKKDEEGYLECWFKTTNDKGNIEYVPTLYDVETIINDYSFNLEANNYNFGNI